MSNIKSLIVDIQQLIKEKVRLKDEDLWSAFGKDVSARLSIQFVKEHKPTLRLSAMGDRCPKALWYSIYHPELSEPLPPWAEIKYSFGHMIEALAVTLAKAAGHEVTGEQDELVLDGIVGHRDCVIDGCTVDVKSAATFSFNKFKGSSFLDTFGYLDQLDGYILASKDDPLVRLKDGGFLFVIDKQLGHMHLYEHHTTEDRANILKARIKHYKAIVANPIPPACECGTQVESNGNIRLDLKASYSPFKKCCFPLLRTFLYASGPVFLTKVVKRPFNKDGPIPEV